ncbi:MAG: aminoglycoside phosphotransferase [Acidimicrobiales bacterium]|nr:aminoglycoside phosphotransferase [Acidimicrobiales bacterium]
MDDEEEVLHGGVDNAGAVVRIGTVVLRPTNPHSATIHALLRHVRAAGFDGAPEVLGVEPDGRERLRYVVGDVPTIPFPAWSQADAVLASTASLLRAFHDATVGFVAPAGATWSTEMADPAPGDVPVVCHNDVCPENVVHRAGVAVALLDFDFAAPGRRAFDVASMARMCVPIDTEEGAARTGRPGLDPFNRLRLVADAYGFDARERRELVGALGDQIADGGAFVRRRVEAGQPAFVAMWQAMGGQERYDRRHRWFAANRQRFLDAVEAT